MNKTTLSLIVILGMLLPVAALSASPPYVEVQPGAVKSAATQAGYTPAPASGR